MTTKEELNFHTTLCNFYMQQHATRVKNAIGEEEYNRLKEREYFIEKYEANNGYLTEELSEELDKVTNILYIKEF